MGDSRNPSRSHASFDEQDARTQLEMILDRRAGITDEMRLSEIDTDLLDGTTAVAPWPEKRVQAALQETSRRARRESAPDASVAAPRRARLWKAAALLFLALLGSAVVARFWDGKTSRHLSVEDARSAIFDERYSLSSRLAALGKTAASVNWGRRVLQKLGKETGPVGRDARTAVSFLRILLRDPQSATPGVGYATFDHAKAIAILTSTDRSDRVDLRLQAVEGMRDHFQTSVYILHRVQELGPEFRKLASGRLMEILKRLEAFDRKGR